MPTVPFRSSSIIRAPSDPFPNLMGRGVAYPIQKSDTGGMTLVEGEELVRQSIRSILRTTVGERPFMVRSGVPYGTRIAFYQFDNASRIRDLARFEVKQALSVWEPRIAVNYVDVTDAASTGERDPRVVGIVVNYRFRTTNRVDNMVVSIPTRSTR